MKAQLLVARNLRRLRVIKGLSQENLAVDAGIVEFFVVPAKGEPAPKPLRGGRRTGT